MKFFNVLKYFLYIVTIGLLVINIIKFNELMIVLCIISLSLYTIINFFEYLFNLKITPLLKFILNIFVFFSIALGEVCSLYSYLSFYDSILHFISGVIGGIIALSIIINIFNNKIEQKYIKVVLTFIVCFSLSLGVLWEFFEFGIDKYYGKNMQKDNIITKIDSSFFYDKKLTNINISNINKTNIYSDNKMVTIDGGYLDIGLTDTIEDLIFDLMGGIFFSFVSFKYFSNNKYKFIKYLIIKRINV